MSGAKSQRPDENTPDRLTNLTKRRPGELEGRANSRAIGAKTSSYLNVYLILASVAMDTAGNLHFALPEPGSAIRVGVPDSFDQAPIAVLGK